MLTDKELIILGLKERLRHIETKIQRLIMEVQDYDWTSRFQNDHRNKMTEYFKEIDQILAKLDELEPQNDEIPF